MGVMLGLILANQETIMFDNTKIAAEIARLQADDDAAIALLQQLRDQNKDAQAQLADVSKQLADLKAGGGGDTQAVQDAIDKIASDLGATADKIEAAVAANPATPNLPPAAPTA